MAYLWGEGETPSTGKVLFQSKVHKGSKGKARPKMNTANKGRKVKSNGK